MKPDRLPAPRTTADAVHPDDERAGAADQQREPSPAPPHPPYEQIASTSHTTTSTGTEMKIVVIGGTGLIGSEARRRDHAGQPFMRFRVSVASPEAADYGVAELSAAGELIGHTVL